MVIGPALLLLFIMPVGSTYNVTIAKTKKKHQKLKTKIHINSNKTSRRVLFLLANEQHQNIISHTSSEQ